MFKRKTITSYPKCYKDDVNISLSQENKIWKLWFHSHGASPFPKIVFNIYINDGDTSTSDHHATDIETQLYKRLSPQQTHSPILQYLKSIKFFHVEIP